MLLGHMSVEVLREEACDCLYEIVNKGMDPNDKTKLVESLCQVLQSAGFFSINQVCDINILFFKYVLHSLVRLFMGGDVYAVHVNIPYVCFGMVKRLDVIGCVGFLVFAM